MRPALIATLALLLCAAQDPPRFDTGTVRGKVESELVTEASGIAASRTNEGVLWVHNDSGDHARFYALGPDAKLLSVCNLTGVEARDWEDMAIGPAGRGKFYLYAADIGDNNQVHEFIRIHRVPEPKLGPKPREAAVDLRGVESTTLQYPEGKRYDAETLLVDPVEGDLYVITKSPDGDSGVFRLKVKSGMPKRAVLEKVGEIKFGEGKLKGHPMVTGGDISPKGDFIILRTYTHAFLWTRAKGATIAEAFAGDPVRVPLKLEKQGEAICFDAEGKGYFSVSEGRNQPLYYYSREE